MRHLWAFASLALIGMVSLIMAMSAAATQLCRAGLFWLC